ncbi:MAG: tyrosine-type recombinase/integrase [Reyranella sp.]|nr:tyrosine-type recombinase/integrase [Reyranella sp.]
MVRMGRLTALHVARANKPGLLGDGHGLYLRVGPTGTRSWIFRYQQDGRRRDMGLGSVEVIGLSDARVKAIEARRLLLDSVDPIGARKSRRQAAAAVAARAVTFKVAAAQFIAANKSGWRNPKHAAQWTATLEAYAYPTIGNVSVAEIDPPMIFKVLEPIWSVKTETARRVRGRIESVLDWARARGFRNNENPARWRGLLEHMLPKQPKATLVQHHPALPYGDVAALMEAVAMQSGDAARALEFTVLTAARTSEVTGAKWEEIDFSSRIWTIPASRIKAGREHRVPLSDAALEIVLEQAKTRRNEYVFPGGRDKRPLSNMAMAELLKRMREAKIAVALAQISDGRRKRHFTVHGFRSSFRDWAAEQSSHPSEVAEMALAHVVGDKVEAAYRRGDLLRKRFGLMTDWAAYCGRGVAVAESAPLAAIVEPPKSRTRRA